MPFTDRGRFVFRVLDERGTNIFNNKIGADGSFVFGILVTDNNTSLTFVENVVIQSTSPSSTPNVNIISVDHYKISKQAGISSSHIVFSFDSDVTTWSINVMGVDHTTGTIAQSGGAVTSGTQITAIVDYTEMYQEGNNRVNIYGQNSIGWTPYGT